MYSCFITLASSVSQLVNELDTRFKKPMFSEKFNEHHVTFFVADSDLSFAWQVALNLECAGFAVGYGVGRTETEAKSKADQNWAARQEHLYA